MSTSTRIAAFLLALGAVFAAAFAVGAAFEPAATEAGGGHGEMAAVEEGGHEGAHGSADEEGAHGAGDEGAHGGHASAPAGLAVADEDYALALQRTRFERGEPSRLRFRIEDPAGAAVKRFDELHERRLHLIVVRRDGSGFQHLHPELAADGTWTVATELDAAGEYRAFADFAVDGEQHTLAADLFVSGGPYEARPFPAPAARARSGRYEVALDAGSLRAGRPARLSFAVSRDGEPVADLQPYLGARGHLVALREGDLAYLHVHPEDGGHEHGAATAAEHPGEIAFAATFPTAGRYRLYLQFRHAGAVRTAELTLEVGR